MPDSQGKDHIQRWKLEELVSIVDEFDDCLCNKINTEHPKFAYDYKNILYSMAGKSIVTMKEMICLVQCGYPDGALSLARNLYEQFIVAAFLEGHKEDADFQDYIDDFYLDYEIQQNNFLQYEAEYVQHDLNKKAQLRIELENIKSSAHHKGEVGYWWTGKQSFSRLTKEIIEMQPDDMYKKFVAMNHILYKQACVLLHVSCAGNMLRLGTEPDFVGVDCSAHTDGHEAPLLFSTISFLYVLAVVCAELGIDAKEWKEKLLDLLEYYNSFLGGNEGV